MNGQFAARMSKTLTKGTGKPVQLFIDHGKYTFVCGGRVLTLNHQVTEAQALQALKGFVGSIYS